LLIGLVALGLAGVYFDPLAPENGSWQTMLFTTLAFLQIGQALASRSTDTSFFQQGWRSNPTLLGMVIVTFILQLMVIYLPSLDQFFGVVPLTLPELGVSLLVGTLAFVAIEVEKLFRQRKR
jgi:Ca2+-transporting ATPase